MLWIAGREFEGLGGIKENKGDNNTENIKNRNYHLLGTIITIVMKIMFNV